ncbi:acyl- n-acyltransferase [Ophiostoma piceae UAMH 11346]|uniref:Acyl-n-acyltransferase n=1 Tax=Ophiostoma piceae (strain UAMH 11346) TaxID=1262450 RepID=S3CA45_OPHP1|nr:acyl- n-acyltransferase [Ophiostoma piceae UAMH 11346]
MKVNENTAISTAGVLLVPYDSRHVPTYHAWMEDEAIRTATASDRLTLEEEYENQVSWRADADKLTFILCQPLAEKDTEGDSVAAGIDDAPGRMIGDINFFLYPYEEEEDGDRQGNQPETNTSQPLLYSGEVDVMIARPEHRGQGFGRAAVTAFLHYILEQNRAAILYEAVAAEATASPTTPTQTQPHQLKQLMVKIQATNEASIGLFKSLGFAQKGSVNYFGEVELTRSTLDAPAPTAYAEKVYKRTDA